MLTENGIGKHDPSHLSKAVLKTSRNLVAPELPQASLPGTLASTAPHPMPKTTEDVADTTYQQQVHNQTASMTAPAVSSLMRSMTPQSRCGNQHSQSIPDHESCGMLRTQDLATGNHHSCKETPDRSETRLSIFQKLRLRVCAQQAAHNAHAQKQRY